MKIRAKHPDLTKVRRAHYNDAGIDIPLQSSLMIKPFETLVVPTSLKLDLPDGFFGYIVERTSMAKKGLLVHHSPIDSGYKGEIHLIITNISVLPHSFNEGDRIGQLVILPYLDVELVEDLGDERGTGGFGSTGK